MMSYWSVDEGLGNSLILKAMTKARFLEILQNIHFADNHKELPPKESEEYDRAWELRPLFDPLGSIFRICCNQKLTNRLTSTCVSSREKHNETMHEK